MTSRDEFGPTLRRHREQRGVSLDLIARETKVPASLWAAMERNDLSRWPTGIYARAYIRSYAALVGLDPREVVEAFCRFFPHGDRRAEPVLRAAAEIVQHDLHWEDDLAAAGTRDRRARPAPPDAPADRTHRLTARAPVLEVAAMVVVAAAICLIGGWSFWVVLAIVALFFHAGSVAVLGRGPFLAGIEACARRLGALLRALPSGVPASVRK